MTSKIIQLRPKITRRTKPRGLRKRHSLQRRRHAFFRSFGRRLKYARAQLCISEPAAAEAFGVTAKTYLRYEAGLPPRDGSLGYLDFADTFDVPLPWLLGMRGALPPRWRLRVV